MKGIRSTGVVFNIQRYSVNDGPGIRTTVFMKGCPLDCLWCHNPESKSMNPELFFNSDKCIGCEACKMICLNNCHRFSNSGHMLNRERCSSCGRCANVCAGGALVLTGKKMTVDEVISEVRKDEPFYSESGGGMTVSGGEPFMQYLFLSNLLHTAKAQGLHICLETCGYTDFEKIRAVEPYVDTFLYDFKETDEARHKKCTGVSNERIIQNLIMLNDLSADIILRCPIIEGLNDRTDHFSGIAGIAEKCRSIRRIDIEPYHPLGKSKCRDLGKDYPLSDMNFPDKNLVLEWIERIRSQTSCLVEKA